MPWKAKLILFPSRTSKWSVRGVGKGGATNGNNFISGVKNKVAAPEHSVIPHGDKETNFLLQIMGIHAYISS